MNHSLDNGNSTRIALLRQDIDKQKTEITEAIIRYSQKSWFFGSSRLCLFIGIFIFLALNESIGIIAYTGATICFITFLISGPWHSRCDNERARLKRALIQNKEREQRINGDWTYQTRDGASYRTENDAVSSDCDLFGAHSYFGLLNTCISKRGEDFLGDLLNGNRKITTVQQSLCDKLSTETNWRANWRSIASELVDINLEKSSTAKSPSVLFSFIVSLILITSAFLALNSLASIPALISLLILAGIGDFINRPSRLQLSDDPDYWIRQTQELTKLLSLILQLNTSQNNWQERAKSIHAKIQKSTHILNFISQGSNPLWRFSIGAYFQADRFLIAYWLKRHQNEQDGVESALALIEEIDLCQAIASHIHENAVCWNSHNNESNALSIRATQLAHPLIHSEKRIANDVDLKSGDLLLLSGANASGKSTYMRAVAIACVCAKANLPICAQSAEIFAPRPATVMRVADAVWRGESRFQAEINALANALQEGQNEDDNLMLFDEILSGTNSKERHIGSQAIIQHLIDHNVSAIISTHDLELCEYYANNKNIKLAHFADNGDNANSQFDYMLRDGMLTSTNALRLMANAGLPVHPQ